MSYLSSLAGSVTSFTATIIVAIAIHVPFLFSALMSIPYTPPAQPVVPTANHVAAHTVSSATAVTKPQPPIEQAPTISSSTSQIGTFTAVTTCENYGDRDFNPVNITLSKDGSTTQTIGVHGSDSGTSSCPKAISQDVNFDGYPDITLLTGTGSGGGAISYWLYASTTGQFACNEPYDTCGFMNPQFDPSTKTVTSEGQEGADNIEIHIYQSINGQLVQIKQYEGSDEGAIQAGFNIGY